MGSDAERSEPSEPRAPRKERGARASSARRLRGAQAGLVKGDERQPHLTRIARAQVTGIIRSAFISLHPASPQNGGD